PARGDGSSKPRRLNSPPRPDPLEPDGVLRWPIQACFIMTVKIIIILRGKKPKNTPGGPGYHSIGDFYKKSVGGGGHHRVHGAQAQPVAQRALLAGEVGNGVAGQHVETRP